MPHTTPWTSFRVYPPNLPNSGILYVDHERHGRSGHSGNTLTECRNGDIVSFYSNVSGCADAINGHSVAGWSEYRRSTDGGQTWGEPTILDYSRRVWEGDEMFSSLVWASMTAPDGTLIAVLPRFLDRCWQRQDTPVYILSHDHGHTWSEPREIDPDASVDEVAVSFDACLVRGDEVMIMFSGGVGGVGPGPYTLYVSGDNGHSFQKRSTLPFHHTNYYGTIAELPDGRLVAYSYAMQGATILKDFNVGDGGSQIDEYHLHVTISDDGGRTWSEVDKVFFAKQIRNPQMSDRIGDYYFMHGRSGSHGEAPGNFVLYSSKDGLNWDEGIYLQKKVYEGGDKYSANEIIGKYDPAVPNRLLIQSSIAYNAGTNCVNERHWWIDRIAGTETDAPRYQTLHDATAAGDLEEMTQLLNNGGDVDACDLDGLTPVALALNHGHVEAAALLFANGADVNRRCKYGRAPLHRAIRTQQVELAKWLLANGADARAIERGITFLPAIGVAAEVGSLELIDLLLDHGADLDQTDKDDAPPLFVAALYGQTSIVEELIRRGATVEGTDRFGRDVVQIAEVGGYPETADALRRHLNQPTA